MKYMINKYECNCRSCGRNIKEGERVYYDRAGRMGSKIVCVKCKENYEGVPIRKTKDGPSHNPWRWSVSWKADETKRMKGSHK